MSSLLGQYGLGVLLTAKNQISGQAKQAELSLKSLGRTSSLTASQVKTHAEKMSQAMDAFRRSLKVGAGMMIGGAVLMTPFAMAAKAAASSEDRMNNVESLLVATGNSAEAASLQVSGLSASILKMAGNTRIPLADMEKAAYDLVSADLSVAEAQGVLPYTSKLAVAGMGSMAEATDSMTAVMNSYGKAWGDSITATQKGAKIANVYAGTVAALKTTLPGLSGAMAYAAADAHSLGVSLAETTVAIGMLQTKGIQGARAGTSLAAMFRELINLQNKSASVAGPLAGLEIADATGKIKPLANIIADIEKRLAGLGEVERGAVLTRAFGDEGKRALQNLIGQSEAYREKVKVTKESNALDDMVAARQKGVLAQYQMMKNTVHSLAISLGTSLLPAVNQTIQIFKQMVNAVKNFTDAHPLLTRMITATVMLAGAGLMVGGMLKIVTAALTAYKVLMPVVNVLTGTTAITMSGLAASVWSVLAPVLAVTIAMAGLAYLIDKIAGTDIIGSIGEFFTMPSMPAVSMAGGGTTVPGTLSGPAVDIPEDQGRETSSRINNVNDYSTVKIVNNNYPSKSMDTKEFAEQIAKNSKDEIKRKTEGNF